jgi:hypothetical protein
MIPDALACTQILPGSTARQALLQYTASPRLGLAALRGPGMAFKAPPGGREGGTSSSVGAASEPAGRQFPAPSLLNRRVVVGKSSVTALDFWAETLYNRRRECKGKANITQIPQLQHTGLGGAY